MLATAARRPWFWLAAAGAMALAVWLVLEAGRPAPVRPPAARAGVLDLRGWEGLTSEPVRLDGEWEFYWKELLWPGEFPPPDRATHSKVPRAWGAPEGLGAGPAFGYATYRLRMLVPPGVGELALLLREQMTACRVFVNGREKGGAGVVGAGAEGHTHGRGGLFVPVEASGGEVELVVWVSNYSHRTGGLVNGLRFGGFNALAEQRNRETAFQMSIIGALLFTGFYHVGLWASRRRECSALFFGAVCLIAALRQVNIFENTLGQVLGLEALRSNQLEYLATANALWVFVYYLHSVFPERWLAGARRVFLGLGLCFSLLIVFAPLWVFSYLSFPIMAGAATVALMGLVVAARSALRGGTDGVLFLAGAGALVAAVAADILYHLFILRTEVRSTHGLLVFTFFQALLLSRRFTRSFALAEELGEQLESKVAERTAELTARTAELGRREAAMQDSLRYAQRIQRALFTFERPLAETFPENVVIYRPRDIISGDFLWFRPVRTPAGPAHVLAVADCTGHGVPGAFMSVVGNALLQRAVVERRLTDPAAILEEVDTALRETLHRDQLDGVGDGLDLAVCLLRPEGGRLAFAGAHLPLLLVRPGADGAPAAVTVAKGTRRSLGGRPQRDPRPFATQELEPRPGDLLVLHTDGVVDQFDPARQRFGTPRWHALLAAAAALPAPALKGAIEEALDAWRAGEPPLDDLTVVALRWPG